MSALRIRNYIKEVGIEEERAEKFIARCANSQDPSSLMSYRRCAGVLSTRASHPLSSDIVALAGESIL